MEINSLNEIDELLLSFKSYPARLAAALGIAYENNKGKGGWRKVAQDFFKDTIPAGTLNRIYKSGGKYLPTNPAHRKILLLDKWPLKKLEKMSSKELLYRLENREDI